MKRFTALLLSILLMLSSACAYALELPASAEKWLLPEERVAFTLGMSFEQLLPFGESTVNMLNDCMQHIAVSISLGENDMHAAVFAGGVQAALFAENTADGRSVLQTDMLANRTLTAGNSAFAALSGAENNETGSQGIFSLPQAIPEAEAAWPALYEALADYGEDKAVNIKLKGAGVAKWARTARLNKEQCAELHDLFCALLRCGLSDEYREIIDQLIFSKQFNATVYFTGEGEKAFAVALTGKAKHPDGKYMELNYLYAFPDEGITYRLELGKGKRAGIAVSGTLTMLNGETQYSYEAEWKTAVKSGDGKTARDYTDTLSLNGSGDGARTLKGSITHTGVISGSEDQQTSESTLLDLQAQNNVMTGTVKLTGTQNGLPRDSITLIFTPPMEVKEDSLTDSLQAGSHNDASRVYDTTTDQSGYLVGTPPLGVTAYSAPEVPITVDLDALTESELRSLQDELFQNTAAHILLRLLENVPAADLALLYDNVDEAAFQAFADRIFSVK